MRTFLFVAVALILGCTNQTTETSEARYGFLGEWEGTDEGLPKHVTYSFSADGTVTQRSADAKDQHYIWKAETIEDWARRHDGENKTLTDRGVKKVCSPVGFMITLHNSSGPDKSKPGFLYMTKDDTLEIFLIAKLRRVEGR
ncbi:MAG: hypothetical protein M3R13_09245 [Armatimonadota bacterium]|nr:hypothetical protein [Armatimonadota bacterium]